MPSLIPSTVWVIIPAYNESKTIALVLEQLVLYGYHVVVVDDGSSDETSLRVLQFPVILHKHAVNLGQGAALQTGLEYALGQSTGRYIVTFDADGQHNAGDIAVLLEPLLSGRFEAILGSRFIAGGKATGIGAWRRFVLRLAVLFTRLTTGLGVTDTHNGLRAFTIEAAAKIKITQNRMAHASEILSQIGRQKLCYCEVPVKVAYTSYSQSKGQQVIEGINILWDIISGKLR